MRRRRRPCLCLSRWRLRACSGRLAGERAAGSSLRGPWRRTEPGWSECLGTTGGLCGRGAGATAQKWTRSRGYGGVTAGCLLSVSDAGGPSGGDRLLVFRDVGRAVRSLGGRSQLDCDTARCGEGVFAPEMGGHSKKTLPRALRSSRASLRRPPAIGVRGHDGKITASLVTSSAKPKMNACMCPPPPPRDLASPLHVPCPVVT